MSLARRHFQTQIVCPFVGHKGLSSGMGANKYRRVTYTFKVTATRDLADMAKCDALVRKGKGAGFRHEIA